MAKDAPAGRRLSPLTEQALGASTAMGGVGAALAMILGAGAMIGVVVIVLRVLIAEAGLGMTTAKVLGFAGIVAVVALMFVLSRFVARRKAARALAKLEGLPFSFNLDSYLGALGVERGMVRPTVVIDLASPVSVEEQPKLRHLVEEAVDDATATWRNGSLAVTGPACEARFRSSSDSSEYHSNARVHAWCLAFLERAALPLHQRSPIRALRITLGSP